MSQAREKVPKDLWSKQDSDQLAFKKGQADHHHWSFTFITDHRFLKILCSPTIAFTWLYSIDFSRSLCWPISNILFTIQNRFIKIPELANQCLLLLLYSTDFSRVLFWQIRDSLWFITQISHHPCADSKDFSKYLCRPIRVFHFYLTAQIFQNPCAYQSMSSPFIIMYSCL